MAACGGHATESPAGTTVQISISRCGQGWTHPGAGEQRLTLRNTDTRAAEVYLTDANSGAIYAAVDNLGPGASADMDIDLGSGSYAFRCAMEDEDVVAGPMVVIPGKVAMPIRPVQAVSQGDLITVTKQYEAYVNAALPTLSAQTSALAGDVAAGRLAMARHDWLIAHLSYERLGAAYDAFGDADREINGLPSGLPGGINDADFTGFHRLEYGLWHGEPASELAPIAKALVGFVRDLETEFPSEQVDPLDISLRAHEIVENALQFELTGQSDLGSHSNLATSRANLDGTQELITILAPLLANRYEANRQLSAQLTKAMTDLDPLVSSGLPDLTRAQREMVDADFSNLSELLAPVASILEPRRAS
jgi:iron uptake system component EfeO